MLPRLLILSSLVAAIHTGTVVDATTPIKVFILAGQSNTVGHGSIDHMDLLVAANSTGSNNHSEYRDLWNGTAYRVRDDVFIQYGNNMGNLTLKRGDSGYGAPDQFGPELGIGWVVGDALKDERIVLIKTAWGGMSLSVDFRPPSSGEGNYSNVKPVQYGWRYRQMILDTINALQTFVPQYYTDQQDSYELAGLVWFQGWNDMLEWQSVNEYGENLVNFIRDVRLDLDAPNLPVIVGELGMHGMIPQGYDADRVVAMRAMEQGVTRLPEFVHNTLFVPTAPYAVLNGTQYNGIYHYGGRADSYFQIGKAFGRGLLQMIHKTGMIQVGLRATSLS
jgi:hypothetical protein